MSVSVESRIRDLDNQVAQARSAQARAEVTAEAAHRKVDEARSALRSEFGVETPEDGRRVLAELAAELESSLEEAQRALEAASGK